MIQAMLSQPIEIVDRDMARVLADKTEAERLQISWGMWQSARRMLTRLVTNEHAGWTPEQVQAEVSRRLASGT